MSRYTKSEQMLARAEKVIPLGSQTFSKSRTQFPHGVSPYFITHGKGSHVWDVDGNEYIDMINSLNAVTLGYCDPDVDGAVAEQMKKGTIFSLSTELEIQVAERIVEMVPCAEMVRFGKNGSDATAGAIRISRAHTGREHVAVCGYHGWQDWYIGSTARNKGVPKAVQALTHPWLYNDIDSLKKVFADFPGQIAAVIMEPMNVAAPKEGFLQAVKALCQAEGAVLIFDETITGFRYANGGAQQLFGVTPDLATFGKGLANGYPVSAVCGRADIMKQMEEVFFSFTFGGETLSLAAALATLNKLKSQPVVERMGATGKAIMDNTTALIAKHGLGDVLGMAGHPTWSFLTFADARGHTMWQTKTLFVQEMLKRGFLTYGTHNVSYAHTDDDVARLHTAYDEIFAIIAGALNGGGIEALLDCDVLVPLFKVR